MIEAGSDFFIRNDHGEFPFLSLGNKLNNSCEEEEIQVITDLLINIEEKKIQSKSEEKLVWKNPPMHKACQENQCWLLCFFYIIGGRWGSQNNSSNRVYV
jgi:hypothetical protein